jgi:O-antigen/teichoic acid export membrane protein
MMAEAASKPVDYLQDYGRRIGYDTAVYAAGNTAFLIASLVGLTLYTHFMPPSEYGLLSILFFSAGALTIVLNLVPLAGILRWVWVAGEADSGAVDDPSRQAPGGTKRRALGTGCWMSLITTVVGLAVLLPFTEQLSGFLLGTSADGDLVRLAIFSGAAGAFFRVTSNVVRMNRRPGAFSALVAVRPVLALAVGVPLVASGGGVGGALIGTIVGSLITGVAAIAFSYRSYSLRFNWSDLRGITDLGLKYTFVIIGLYTVHNADPIVLSRFTTHANVGVYRVAARLAAVMSYLVASFLQAWSPLERGALFQTTYETHGMARVHSRMITYFVLVGLTVVLGLGLAGGVLVRLAPSSYHDAAGMIPFATFSFVVYGVFVLIARTTYHRHRDLVHNLSAAIAAVVFIGCSALLCPRWGGYGLAISASIGMWVACACFRLIVRSSTHYARLEWPRYVGAGAIAFGCLALGLLAPVGPGAWRAVIGLVDFFVLYPVALLLTNVISMQEARGLAGVARGIVSQALAPLRPARHAAQAAQALSTLPSSDAALLRKLIRDGVDPGAVAQRQRMPVSVIEARAARALRTLTGADAPERDDAAIGHWLFNGQGSAEQDIIMYFLVRHGVPIETLHRVQHGCQLLRSVPDALWSTTASGSSPDLAPAQLQAPTDIGLR